VGEGSGRSFEEFFAATYGRLVGLLFAFLHDRAQAEDAVQDALASALLRWPVLRRYHDPEAWVRRVAFRRAIDHHRRNARQLRALLRLGPPPSSPPVGAEHVDLVRALRRLPWPSGRCWSCTMWPSWRWSGSRPSCGCRSGP
jgi:RNA polymerase sigma-70 factor (ECF subfamily)